MSDGDGTGTGTAPTTTPGATPDATTDGTVDYKALYEATVADAEKWKTFSRKHEKDAKANAEAAQAAATNKDMLAKVAAALGLDSGDKGPDAAAITAQLETAKAQATAQARENAVLRAAGRLGADGDALLDSRAFLAAIGDLDPADATAIGEAIAAAVKANPRYAAGATGTGTGDGIPAAPVPPARQASGTTDFNGAPGGNRQWTEADVARATPAQLRKATTDGLLKQYLSN